MYLIQQLMNVLIPKTRRPSKISYNHIAGMAKRDWYNMELNILLFDIFRPTDFGC